MVGLEEECKELLQNFQLEIITLINNNGRDDWTSSFYLKDIKKKEGLYIPRKHYYSRKDWRKTKMGRPRKNPRNALALLLETGDTQHSAKTTSRQKELSESSLEWKRYVESR